MTPQARFPLYCLLILAGSWAPLPAAEPVDESAAPLQIATRLAPPFAIKSETGWDGITIELLRGVAEKVGFDYQLREMGLQEMLQQTAEGRIDAAAAALTVTAERERTVAGYLGPEA